jgi:DNA-binding MarR family transcriptional regulator
MTHRLDLLTERGLIARTVDPDNRTRSKVKLTRAGRDLFRRAVLDADVVESDVLASLTAASNDSWPTCSRSCSTRNSCALNQVASLST